MADSIEGVAILEENHPVCPILHFVCVQEAGKRLPWRDHVPIARGGVKPPGYTGQCWSYVERPGGWLDCSPSVKMMYQEKWNRETGELLPESRWHWVEFFHNAGAWSVRFERWAGEPNDGAGIRNRMLELNAGLLTRGAVADPEPARPGSVLDPAPARPVVGPPAVPKPRHPKQPGYGAWG